MENRIANLKQAKGMWIKIDPRHRTMHFVQTGQNTTLCGIRVPKTLFLAIGKCRDCPTCEEKIYELEPELTAQIKLLESEIERSLKFASS